ncbi:MAG: FHA domain-containing protein [Clostridium sp.]|uniref:FHA domain-containing protein n=1 Tax=Clostridium sp. TaxID=1506 RepID=UPI003EE45316
MYLFKKINNDFLAIELEKISVVNREELEFINTNNELGFIYIEINQFNNKAKLIYNIEDKITLSELLENEINIGQAISIIKDLILIKDISNSTINIRKILLDIDKIYVDSSTESTRIKFVYLPINKDMQEMNQKTDIEEIALKVIEALENKNDVERLKLILKSKSIKSVSTELVYLFNENYKNKLKKINRDREIKEKQEALSKVQQQQKKEEREVENLFFFKKLKKIFSKASELKKNAILNYFDGEKIVEFQLKNNNVIGRSLENCTITIEGKTVSKVHAIIKKFDNKYYVLDENSKNGTYINGKRISKNNYFILRDGDEILFGNVICIFKGE